MFSTLVCVIFATVSFAEGLRNEYCSMSCDFGEKLIFKHTVCERDQQRCGPAQRCGKDFRVLHFTYDIRQFLLDLHNELRSKVASGKEARGRQPSASDMMVLKYNRELEFIAQCWANTCQGNPLVHDRCRSAKGFEYVGQNLGFYTRSNENFDFKRTLRSLIMYWYNEVELFQREWVNYTDDRGPHMKVGHYTQMMWADTTDIGCAAAYYTTKPAQPHNIKKWYNIVFVCNYAPGGNYISLPVYKIGTPSSGCPYGTKPNKQFIGLCGGSRRVNETDQNFRPLFRM